VLPFERLASSSGSQPPAHQQAAERLADGARRRVEDPAEPDHDGAVRVARSASACPCGCSARGSGGPRRARCPRDVPRSSLGLASRCRSARPREATDAAHRSSPPATTRAAAHASTPAALARPGPMAQGLGAVWRTARSRRSSSALIRAGTAGAAPGPMFWSAIAAATAGPDPRRRAPGQLGTAMRPRGPSPQDVGRSQAVPRSAGAQHPASAGAACSPRAINVRRACPRFCTSGL